MSWLMTRGELAGLVGGVIGGFLAGVVGMVALLRRLDGPRG